MDWTVDYGDGPRPCSVPHAWRQDVDVRWEGPATYRCTLEVDQDGKALRFWGVSYAAQVFLDGTLAHEHRGIWDAFDVPLGSGGRTVEIMVVVTKNGGATFPVKDVLSGFLPYVFHSFGGIFREVEIVDADTSIAQDQCHPRMTVDGHQLVLDGEPWFMRGLLSWGWYPQLGHANPTADQIRDEVKRAKSLGFNLIKFCLWLPPHAYFQVLAEEDMWAWVELPLWMPTHDSEKLEAMFEECRRIVEQYRHHDRIVAWTCGCELSESTSHDFRKRLVEMVTDLTGSPLVKDNSGGSEMYGGDLREYGSFYDFHPYCDTHFYPPVLDSLSIGPRRDMPVLLGEFNDYDVYRPLGSWTGEEQLTMHTECPWIVCDYTSNRPYWASSLPELNHQGVRWQHDVPAVLDANPEVSEQDEQLLRDESLARSGFIRETVTRAIAGRGDIAGYVVTGLSDTPISTSGIVDQTSNSLGNIFSDITFFVVPYRCPPWEKGGNRPGWRDGAVLFQGENTIRIGVRSTKDLDTRLDVRWESGHSFTHTISVRAGRPSVVLELTLDLQDSDTLWLTAEGQDTLFSFFPIKQLEQAELADWSIHDPDGYLGGSKTGGSRVLSLTNSFDAPGVHFLRNVGTLPRPFWRECTLLSESLDLNGLSNDHLFSVATDCVIDPRWLRDEDLDAEWLLTRVDNRTYERLPLVVRSRSSVFTTLRPWGGLGCQPGTLKDNPAGHNLIRTLMSLV